MKSKLLWLLPSALLIIHNIEEYFFGFPRWATEHFGSTSVTFYIASHVFLLLVLLLIGVKASDTKSSRIWRIFVIASLVQFVVNSIFHVASLFIYQQYSPGVVTGLFIILPISLVALWNLRKRNIVDRHSHIMGITLGALIAVLVVTSLWLDL